MICPNCGKELSDSAVMCWRCGRIVPPLYAGGSPGHAYQAPRSCETPDGDDWYQPRPAAQTYTGPEVPPPVRKNPKQLLIGICIAIVVVAVIAVLIGVFAGTRTGGVVTIGEPQGYATHQELIQSYCDYYSDADETAMVTLYPQALRDYLADAGYGDVSSFLRDRDEWCGGYGESIENWMISDVAEYSAADFAAVSSDLGVNIQSAADVEVTVQFDGDDEYWTFDFDLIEIDGEWYLFSVW